MFEPLSCPIAPRPPLYPEVPPARQGWERVPLIGGMLRRIQRFIREGRYCREILLPAERQIVEQLSARSVDEPDPFQEHPVVRLLAEAIAQEKDIPNPLIHPEDPIDVLCWGVYDDLTLLQFSFAMKEQFGVRVENDDVPRIIEMNVGEFVAFYSKRIESTEHRFSSRPAKSGPRVNWDWVIGLAATALCVLLGVLAYL